MSTTQKGSDSVAYDPDDKKVFVSNGDSNSITVVDATTLKVLKQINLPGAPEIAVWDTADHTLRQNLSDKNQQVIIDPKTDSVTRTIETNASQNAGTRRVRAWPTRSNTTSAKHNPRSIACTRRLG